ncbi:MAG: choice-of-anchor A family protein [Caulobacterales bacterium]|nr:choice-of-anchor A family protein [Caulobacterales bacterium]
MRKILGLAPVATALLLVGAPAAVAGPLPPSANAAQIQAGLQAMRDYNLIALKDLSSSSEVEGRAFVGGNLSGNSSNYFTQPHGLTGGNGLVVAGNVSGGTKQVNNGAALAVGGNLTSGANMNAGPGGTGTVKVGGSISGGTVNANNTAVYVNGDVANVNAHDVYYGGALGANVNGVKHAGDTSQATLGADLAAQAAAYATDFADLSAYLDGLTPSGPLSSLLTYSGQTAKFNAGAGTGVAVFDIADLAAALAGMSNIQFTLPTTYDLVVINVTSPSFTMSGGVNFNGPTNLGQKVIWNFVNATTLNLGSSFFGSVLAPNATLTNGNFIEGSVVAKSVNQNGEIHMNNLTGGLGPIATPTPEPAAWALMILGFGAAGAALRRRRLLSV